MRGDRITLDVVTVGDFGPFHCIATNEVEGESKTVTFQIGLVKSGKYGTWKYDTYILPYYYIV